MSKRRPKSAPPISSAPARCGAAAEEEDGGERRRGRGGRRAIELGEKRYVELSAAEQFVLTVSERGYGKRSSSYEYRTTSRGGKGIVAMALTKARPDKIGLVSFPVEEGDQIMLVTDAGKLIRTPVAGIRIAGRSTQGVIVLNTAEDETRGVGRAAERRRRRVIYCCCGSPRRPQ